MAHYYLPVRQSCRDEEVHVRLSQQEPDVVVTCRPSGRESSGCEEIGSGGVPARPEGMRLPDGSTRITPALGASGIDVIGEGPAGAERPMLGMPNGQQVPDFAALAGPTGIFPAMSTGFVPGANVGMYGSMAGPYCERPTMEFPQTGGFPRPRTTNGPPPRFPQRPSGEEGAPAPPR